MLRGVSEKYTERARQVLVLAQEEARTLKHNNIGTEHLLLGLLREQEGLAARVLASLGIGVERTREQVTRIVGSGEEPTPGQIPFTPRAKKTLELALREAMSLGHNYIGTEHLLLGLVWENEGVAARILRDFDADPETIRTAVITDLPGSDAQRRAEEPTASGHEDWTAAAPPAIDPGWLDGLPMLLAPLGAEIRSQLGRAPDLGDLLLACACVPHTPAYRALGQLGIDVDELWTVIERARAQAQAERHALAERMREAAQAKGQAIEQGRLEDAARLRDQERRLREQARAHPRAQLATVGELRRRLGLTPSRRGRERISSAPVQAERAESCPRGPRARDPSGASCGVSLVICMNSHEPEEVTSCPTHSRSA